MHDLATLLTLAGALAGALVGPFTPGFVANREIAQQFAEIGVILLLFGMGLRFHLGELIADDSAHRARTTPIRRS